MRILFIGDVVGEPGRRALTRHLAGLRRQTEADAVIVNGENAAGGAGISTATCKEILAAGADVVTGGNHSFHQKEVMKYHDQEPRLLRPDNYPPEATIPGRGCGIFDVRGHTLAVLNLCGRANLGPYENPFPWARRRVEELRCQAPIVIVDFHAEVTSEKIAMGWYLDGLASAVIGTHTHVQTADERILPGGTAFICDVGMTGPHDSVLGIEREIVIGRFLDALPRRHEVAKGNVRISAAVVEVDALSGRALSIARLSEPVEL